MRRKLILFQRNVTINQEHLTVFKALDSPFFFHTQIHPFFGNVSKHTRKPTGVFETLCVQKYFLHEEVPVIGGLNITISAWMEYDLPPLFPDCKKKNNNNNQFDLRIIYF